MIINGQMKQLVKTAASWTALNPVLLKGQLGIIDNGVGAAPSMVVGDGASTYSLLVPLAGGGGGGSSTYAGLTDKATVDLVTINTPLANALNGKQGTLVSGANIKTVNSISLLGAGNISIAGGGASDWASLTDKATANLPVDNTPLANALALLAPKASPALTGTPTAPTAAPGTNNTQVSTTAFVTAAITAAVAGLFDLKGSIDASANPSYPGSTLKGDAYVITVAGRIGGGAGKVVDIGDVVVASADNAGGTEAAVGASWFVIEHNLVGALIASSNLSDLTNTATAWTNLAADTKVRACVLTGVDVATQGAVTSADTVLSAIGKLQATKTGLTPTVEAIATGSAYTLVAADNGKIKLGVDGSAQQINITVAFNGLGTQIMWLTAAGTITLHPTGVTLNGAASDITFSAALGGIVIVPTAANAFYVIGAIGDLVATDITDSTSAGRVLLTAADAAAQRTALGLGTAALDTALSIGTTVVASRNLATADAFKITPVDTSGGAIVLTHNTGAFTGVQRGFFQRRGANGLTIVAGTGAVSNPDAITVPDGGIVGFICDPVTANKIVLL